MKCTLFRNSLILRWSLYLICFVGPWRSWYHRPRCLAIGRETRSLIINQPEPAVGGIIGVIAVQLVLVCDHGDYERFAVSCGKKGINQ